MKMPATTNPKVEAKPSTDLNIGDAAKQCLMCLEKKVRNLEKRKSKIEANRDKAEKGSKLEKEQEISIRQYEQVTHDLEFARELHKQFLTINSEHEKMVKKQAKREKVERQATEIKRISEILQLQSTLDLLGGDKVREDFKAGRHGAVVLTEDNLDQLDQLYQAISPSRDDSGDEYPQKLNAAAEHLVNILDGKDRQVLGTTYKELKDLLTMINGCGYFEKVKQPEEVVGETAEADEETNEGVEIPAEPETETASPAESEEPESSLDLTAQQQQQPIDLTTEGVKSHMDLPTQPMNTMEQDAFFAPSSTAYQAESEAQFNQPSTQVPDFQSFTNNRPFQFIQASYVMPDPQPAPSVVDPAVIHAQPATSGLQFMSGGFEGTNQSQTSTQPPSQQTQSQPPSQASSGLGIGDINQSSITGANPPVSVPQHPLPQDFATQQAFGQPSLQQKLQPEGLFPNTSVEASSLTAHSGLMGQIRDDPNSSPYEIPPSIPMPPSKPQDQSQLEQQQQQPEEKKFQMNASAAVFQSMYAQVATGNASVNVPPPSVPSDGQSAASGDFSTQNPNPDFQQGYQGNSGFNGVYSRGGGRGNYRNSRNGAGGNAGPNAGPRNGTGSIQNGFTGRQNTGQNSNTRGGRGGYGYGPNPGYRPDNYQNTYNSGGFNPSYQKRGAISNPGGPPGMGSTGPYNRGGSGGMRGGMQRGGAGGSGQRGGGVRGYNRPVN